MALLVETLEKARTRIIIPTPVMSELLVYAGAATAELVARLTRSPTFRVAPWGTRSCSRPIRFDLRRHDIDARDVSPRPIVTLNAAGLYGIACGKDDRDCRGCRLCCQSRGFAADGREDAHRLAD
jgi:hypothetical protein